MIIVLPTLVIPPAEEIGRRARAIALRLAPIVAATYTAGYVTGEVFYRLKARYLP
jgi:hypothetical protein